MDSSANATTTTIGPLSPLHTFSPCVPCDWTAGWSYGWNNSAGWDGSSATWVQGWLVNEAMAMEGSYYGDQILFNLQPTSLYNLSISLNSTSSYSTYSTIPSEVSLSSLPLGTHNVTLTFNSVDSTRAQDADSYVRLLAVETSVSGASSLFKTVDNVAWNDGSGDVSLSAGWNIITAADQTSYVASAEAIQPFTSSLSSNYNSSLSLTSYSGSSYLLTFTGTSLTIYSPLAPSFGSFTPVLDNVTLPAVNTTSPLPNNITYQQVVYSVGGLDATKTHTFTAVNVGNGGGNFGLDFYVVGSATSNGSATVVATTSSSSTSTSTLPSSSSSVAATTTSSSSGSSNIGIAVGCAVGGLAFIGLILLGILKLVQRRRAKKLPLQSPYTLYSAGMAGGKGGGYGGSEKFIPLQNSSSKPSRAAGSVGVSKLKISPPLPVVTLGSQSVTTTPMGLSGFGSNHGDVNETGSTNNLLPHSHSANTLRSNPFSEEQNEFEDLSAVKSDDLQHFDIVQPAAAEVARPNARRSSGLAGSASMLGVPGITKEEARSSVGSFYSQGGDSLVSPTPVTSQFGLEPYEDADEDEMTGGNTTPRDSYIVGWNPHQRKSVAGEIVMDPTSRPPRTNRF